MRVRREFVAACAALVLAACSAAAAGPPESAEDSAPRGTIGGVGALPPPVDSDASREPSDREQGSVEADAAVGSSSTDDSPSASATTTTRAPRTTSGATSTSAPPEEVPTVGEQVMGNRVLMIGDSILASTSRRYGNNMCRALEPLGWQVGIEAEVSREITFGNRVLRRKLDDGWDAALILLGNNYGRNPNVFMAELDKMLTSLVPRPVLLLTVTEFEPVQQEVNDLIRTVGSFYPNVTIVDWAAMSRFDGVLSGDGLHLTDNGREFLAQVIAPYFGTSPVQPGDCLSSTFHDDSAGSVNGPSGNNKRTSTTVRPTSNTVRPTGTTAKQPTATTVRPTQTTVRPSSGSTPATTPTQTSPSQSVAPQQTSPPQQTAASQLPQQSSPPPQTPQTSPPQQTAPPQQTSPPVPVTGSSLTVP